MDRLERISWLAEQIQTITEQIQDGAEVEKRTRHLAHELRSHVGIALVLAEGVARDEGNGTMVAIQDNGTDAHVSYDIEFDETDIADVVMS